MSQNLLTNYFWVSCTEFTFHRCDLVRKLPNLSSDKYCRSNALIPSIVKVIERQAKSHICVMLRLRIGGAFPQDSFQFFMSWCWEIMYYSSDLSSKISNDNKWKYGSVSAQAVWQRCVRESLHMRKHTKNNFKTQKDTWYIIYLFMVYFKTLLLA